MKYTTLITAVSSMTATAFAGTSQEVIAPTPPPAPSLGGWFIGGSFGQFDTESNLNNYEGEGGYYYDSYDSQVEDFSFDMYTLHVGRDLGSQVAGFDVAAYLEVGYLDGESRASFYSGPNDTSPDRINFEAEIVPITINLKLERPLFGPVNFYLTGGIGYAFTEISASAPISDSESGGGFYAQASAGLVYNINSQFELFGGGRWLHLGSLDFGDSGLELDDAFAWELGLRVNF